ncbi:LysE family translocator [Marinobacterium arenosum]|uniref:LysE family translocator n=1 Tax=Marinobacterium arenosum TaxID=2862496 RepID=UPI001C970DC6|nr:LysE family transporter [Marinobacterium arenosum]MBY4678093.1 LysE family transporter [Marinobacterium arenosum]
MLEWLLLAGVMLMGAMIPGANTAVVLRNTLNGSQRDGMITALGLATALAIHVSLSIVGLAAIISETPSLYQAIRWLGSAYLLYMGVTYMLTKPAADGNGGASRSRNPFLSGLMVSLFNPKVLIMFVALFSQILQQEQSWSLKLLYGVTPVVMEFTWLTLIITLLTRPSVQQGLQRVRNRLERTIGAALVLLGIKLGIG